VPDFGGGVLFALNGAKVAAGPDKVLWRLRLLRVPNPDAEGPDALVLTHFQWTFSTVDVKVMRLSVETTDRAPISHRWANYGVAALSGVPICAAPHAFLAGFHLETKLENDADGVAALVVRAVVTSAHMDPEMAPTSIWAADTAPQDDGRGSLHYLDRHTITAQGHSALVGFCFYQATAPSKSHQGKLRARVLSAALPEAERTRSLLGPGMEVDGGQEGPCPSVSSASSWVVVPEAAATPSVFASIGGTSSVAPLVFLVVPQAGVLGRGVAELLDEVVRLDSVGIT